MNQQVTSDTAMRSLGVRIAGVVTGGEIIELVGDVGAGKTTLTKGIAEGLGIAEVVQSPSFTISRVYDAPNNLRLVHYDFYRLHDAGIMADELHETIHDPMTVTIIEWAGIVDGVLPADRLTIAIASSSETDRQVAITAGGEVSGRMLEKLA
ncbi:MAG TPA: tRNA (adenosine(37)-N6)-threonylcarbamoyltransferase complex ATPase subunit type 1 TsaE [Candidatus Saccharimonadales bacterium]|nr:tRNA (adenosine(37)-N6)-threonylcarbamoyltransferase complex ATPase subunit type 1 TsaE [Candidatus Saccharimonadales bacterium]